jgi:uncharacterized protein YdhG (YjbR/CyaY superfamily)
MATVDEYMDSVPDGRKAALAELRRLCRKILKGYQEQIEYGMPAYNKDGKAEVAFASQKQYISLYIMKTQLVDDHREQLAGLSVGKCCIRFGKPADMDFAVIASLLRATVHSPDAPC